MITIPEHLQQRIANKAFELSILDELTSNPKVRQTMNLQLCAMFNWPARINGLLYKVTQVEAYKIVNSGNRTEFKLEGAINFCEWTEKYNEAEIVDIDSALL